MPQRTDKPGPFADLPDGYCEAAGGVLRSGHLMTMPTASYARDALIDPARSGEDRQRAFLCLETLLGAQIRTPPAVSARDRRGGWCWSVGDTLALGPSDNWEDFIGTTLMQIFHHDALPDHADWPTGMVERLRQCVIDAVNCSIRRRVRVSYTNPLAMSIECSALAGEIFGIEEFVGFARARLDEWIAFTERAGGFEEFNSCTYGGVTLPHTATLVELVRDADLRQKALHVERMYFDHVCDFYHHPTRELCMPRSRAYHDRCAGTHLHEYLCVILARRRPGTFPKPRTPAALAAIQYCHATEEQVERLFEAFEKPRVTRVRCEWIGLDHVGPLDQVPPPAAGPHTRRRELCAWRAAEFCVGSVNEIDSWQQRRALGGYVRTAGGAAMIAWKPRIEVAGAETDDLERRWPVLMYFNLCAGQQEGTVLAGLTGVPVDGQWLCGSHWRQKVAGSVHDVSADFGFDLDGMPPAFQPPPLEAGQTWRIDVGGCTVSLLFMGGRLGEVQAAPTVSKTDAGWRVSLLRCDGFRLNWSDPPEAFLALVLEIAPKGRASELREANWSGSGRKLSCSVLAGRRRLSLRYDPPGIAELTRQACWFSVQDEQGTAKR